MSSASAPRPGHANPYFNPFLYFLGKTFTAVCFDTLWRRELLGQNNIPPPGTPIIFAANHRSLADPNLVGTGVPYPIHYFAKEELFKIPVLGWYIRRVNAFPVRREERDVSAFKTSIRVLGKGDGLLLFPEGGRRLDPRRQFIAKAGVGMLACMTGARVVPVGITNSENFTKLGKVRVSYGVPLTPPAGAKREDYQAFTDLIMSRIKELCNER